MSCADCFIKDARIRALVAETRRQILQVHAERLRVDSLRADWTEMLRQRDALLHEVRALRVALYTIQEHDQQPSANIARAVLVTQEREATRAPSHDKI